MRKISRIAALCLAMAGAGTALAVQPANFPATQAKASPQRVSPNADRAIGTPIYSGLQFTWYEYPGYVRFGSENPIASMHEFFNFRGDGFKLYAKDRIQSAGGLYNPEDGYYYMIRLRLADTYWGGYNYVPDAWMRYKADGSGPMEILYDMYNLYSQANDFSAYTYSPDAAHYTPLQDSFYDYRTGKFMAIRFEPEYQEGQLRLIQLGEIDRNTGIFLDDTAEAMNEIYMAMTSDLDGNLYAIRAKLDREGNATGTLLVKLDRDDAYEESLVCELKNNTKPVVVGYQACLEMDRTTNNFFITMYDVDDNGSGTFRLYQVGDDGKQVYSEAKGMANFITKGLYIPYLTADSRNAAGQVKGLTATHTGDGGAFVTLTWTNPTKQWNNKPLASLSAVNIYRDDLLSSIGTINDAVPGQASTFEDQTATQGLHTYYVVPIREGNEAGVRDSLKVFAGRDVPDAPVDIKALTPDGKKVNLSWKAPAQGAQDGFIMPEEVTYNITRMPDNVVVATGLTATKYTDESMGDIMSYTYQVQACNNEGTGLTGESNPVIAGKSVSAPFTFDFTKQSILDAFTLWNPQFGSGYSLSASEFWKGWKGYLGSNPEYLFSPAIKLKGGQEYKMTWYSDLSYYDGEEGTVNYDFGYCPTVDNIMTDMKEEKVVSCGTEAITPKDSYSLRPHVANFTAPADGEYYLYMKTSVTGTATGLFIISGLDIQEKHPQDMEMLALRAINTMPSKKATPVNVTVRNNGTATAAAGSYKIELLQNDYAVIGATDKTPELKPDETATITVEITTENDPGNPLDVNARIVQDGDQNLSNNESDYIRYTVENPKNCPFNVAPEGNVFNDGDAAHQDKRFPVNLAVGKSLIQTVYPGNRIDTSHAEVATHIARIGYIYNNSGSVKNDSITVSYMLVPPSESTLFTKGPKGYCNNAWPQANFRQIYAGNETYHQGRNSLILNLEEPFEYTPGYDIVLAVEHIGASYTDYTIYFDCYDSDPTTDTSNGGWSMHTYTGKWEDLDKPENVFVDAAMPATYFAFNDGTATGVKSIFQTDGAKLSLSLRGGNIYFNGIQAREMSIYDMTGRLMSRTDARGFDSLPVVAPHGFYIISVTDATGVRYVKKAKL